MSECTFSHAVAQLYNAQSKSQNVESTKCSKMNLYHPSVHPEDPSTFTALKGSVLFLFSITAAGVVPCGGHKKSPPTSSIVQIIFSFWSFEISEGISEKSEIYHRLRVIF